MATRGKRRRECKVCRRVWEGEGSACPPCRWALDNMAEARGPTRSLSAHTPGRAERVAEYARRAELGLPLFE